MQSGKNYEYNDSLFLCMGLYEFSGQITYCCIKFSNDTKKFSFESIDHSNEISRYKEIDSFPEIPISEFNKLLKRYERAAIMSQKNTMIRLYLSNFEQVEKGCSFNILYKGYIQYVKQAGFEPYSEQTFADIAEKNGCDISKLSIKGNVFNNRESFKKKFKYDLLYVKSRI